MEKKEKTGLVIGASAMAVLIVVFSILLTAHHGGIAEGRLAQTEYNSASLTSVTHYVTEHDENNNYSFADDAFLIDSFVTYQSLENEAKQKDIDIKETFFNDYKLLAVSREGSFFAVSQVQKFSLSQTTAYVTYYVEDNTIIGGAVNERGVYTIDFIKVAKDASVSLVHFTDKSF